MAVLVQDKVQVTLYLPVLVRDKYVGSEYGIYMWVWDAQDQPRRDGFANMNIYQFKSLEGLGPEQLCKFI